MNTRDFTMMAFGLALALGLSACGKGGDATQAASAASSPAAIAPVASVAVEASAPSAPVPAPAAAATDNAAPGAGVTTVAATSAEAVHPGGEKVFKSVCFMCHQTGAAGAPVFGNKSDWAPRIAKGKATLYKHALEGFTGENGTMPPRGGNPSLKDDEVKAGVDFMVSKAQ